MINEFKCKVAAEAAAKLALSHGATSVIVMVGMPDGKHSAFHARYEGPCLEVRGLLEHGADAIVESLFKKE